MLRTTLLAALATGLLASPALAAPIDSFCTQISDNDKVASDGYPLSDAGSILRQDRANFHRFRNPDAGDEADRTFGSSRARENIPTMFDNGDIERGLAREIVRGYPFICVDIYRNSLSVYRG